MFKINKVFYTYTENREKVQLAFEVTNLDTNERTIHTLLEILNYKASIMNGEYIQHVNVHYANNLTYPMIVLDDPANNITILPTEQNALGIEQEVITDSAQYMPYFNQTISDFTNIPTNYNLTYNNVVAAANTVQPAQEPQPQEPEPQPVQEPEPQPVQKSEVQDLKMYTPSNDSESVNTGNTEGKVAKSEEVIEVAEFKKVAEEVEVTTQEITPKEGHKLEETSPLESVEFKTDNPKEDKEESPTPTPRHKKEKEEKKKEEKEEIKRVCDMLYDVVNIKTDSINDILKIEPDLDENFTFISDDYDVLELKLSSIFTEAKKGKHIEYLPKFLNREYILPNITFKSFKKMCQIIDTYSEGDWLEFLCKFLKANYDNLSSKILNKAFELSFNIFAHDLADKYNVKSEDVYKLIEKIVDIDSLTLTKFDSIMKSYNYFSVRISKTDLREYHVLLNSEDIIFVDTENNEVYNIKDVLDDTKTECNCLNTYQIESCLVAKEDNHYIPQGLFIQGDKTVFIPAVINSIDNLSEKFDIPREDIENIFVENYDEEVGKYYILHPKDMRFVLSEMTEETEDFNELVEMLNDKVCEVVLDDITDDKLLNLYY